MNKSILVAALLLFGSVVSYGQSPNGAYSSPPIGGSGTAVATVAGSSPITSTGTTAITIACPTCTTSAAPITNNVLAKGSGGAQGLANSSITDSGTTVSTTEPFSATALTCGVLNTTSCVITGFGGTSGSATITWPLVAGTANQAIAFSNAISSGGGVTATGQVLAGPAQAVGFNSRSLIISGADGTLGLTNNAGTGFTKLTIGPGTSSFPALCNSGTTLLVGLANATCTTLSPLSASAITGNTFNTGTNCSSAASPAVCAAAAGGSVAIPAGALQTLQVNTTAVTANSQILLTIDEGLGTKLGVTCNTTVATLTQPVVTARSAAASFTIEEPATTSVNPVCVSYMVLN